MDVKWVTRGKYIYVEQAEKFLILGSEDKGYKFHKVFYGLKQELKAKYSRINAYLLHQGFERSENEATIYVMKFNSKVKPIVSLYEDDLLVKRGDLEFVKQFKLNMRKNLKC